MEVGMTNVWTREFTGSYLTHTRALHKERDDVAKYEDCRQPATTNKQMFVAIDQLDNAREFHVNRGGEEGGCNKQQHALDDERGECPAARLLGGRNSAACIANYFACGGVKAALAVVSPAEQGLWGFVLQGRRSSSIAVAWQWQQPRGVCTYRDRRGGMEYRTRCACGTSDKSGS